MPGLIKIHCICSTCSTRMTQSAYPHYSIDLISQTDLSASLVQPDPFDQLDQPSLLDHFDRSVLSTCLPNFSLPILTQLVIIYPIESSEPSSLIGTLDLSIRLARLTCLACSIKIDRFFGSPQIVYHGQLLFII